MGFPNTFPFYFGGSPSIPWAWDLGDFFPAAPSPQNVQPSILKLKSVLYRLATGTFPVARAGAGEFINGRFVGEQPENFLIRASIQPVSGRDLARLPEGMKTAQLIAIYTDTPLRTAFAPEGNVADVVTYQGKKFEVQLVNDWTESGGYTQVIAKRIGQ